MSALSVYIGDVVVPQEGPILSSLCRLGRLVQRLGALAYRNKRIWEFHVTLCALEKKEPPAAFTKTSGCPLNCKIVNGQQSIVNRQYDGDGEDDACQWR